MVCRFLLNILLIVVPYYLFTCYNSKLILVFQFHPESVATCHGRQIFKNFRKITEDYWLELRPSSKTISEKKLFHHGILLVKIFLFHLSFVLSTASFSSRTPELESEFVQMMYALFGMLSPIDV